MPHLVCCLLKIYIFILLFPGLCFTDVEKIFIAGTDVELNCTITAMATVDWKDINRVVDLFQINNGVIHKGNIAEQDAKYDHFDASNPTPTEFMLLIKPIKINDSSRYQCSSFGTLNVVYAVSSEAIVSSISINCSPCKLQGDIVPVVNGTSCDCSCTAAEGFPLTLNLAWNGQTTDTEKVNSTGLQGSYDFSSNVMFTPSVSDTKLNCSVTGYTVDTDLYDIQKELNFDVQYIVSSVSITCSSQCIIQNDTVHAVEDAPCNCSCTATDGYPQDLNLTWNIGTYTDTVSDVSSRLPVSYDFSSNVTFTPSVSDVKKLNCRVEGYTAQGINPDYIQEDLNLNVQYSPTCTLEPQSSSDCNPTFICNCTSNPITTRHHFFQNDENITDSSSNTITTSFDEDEVYTLYCIGFNMINGNEEYGTSNNIIYDQCKSGTVSGLSTEAIIGISAGAAVACIILIVIIHCCFCRGEGKNKDLINDAGMNSVDSYNGDDSQNGFSNTVPVQPLYAAVKKRSRGQTNPGAQSDAILLKETGNGAKELNEDPPMYAEVNRDRKKDNQSNTSPTPAPRDSMPPVSDTVTYADLDHGTKPASNIVHHSDEPHTQYAAIGDI